MTQISSNFPNKCILIRKLYIVGESLPVARPQKIRANESETKRRIPREKAPKPCGSLPAALVPIDPRHGVFPNLVMTPLMATWHALQSEQELYESFWNECTAIVKDLSDRRFNVFDEPELMPKGEERNDRFKISQTAIEGVTRLMLGSELWIVSGFTSCFGLIMHWVTKQSEMRRHEVADFANEFIDEAIKAWQIGMNIPVCHEKSQTSQLGYLHRLCADPEPDRSGATKLLQKAVQKYAADEPERERFLHCLRSLCPFLHDDAWKNVPIGNNQKHFLLTADPESLGLHFPFRPYWRFMGASIKSRLTDLF